MSSKSVIFKYPLKMYVSDLELPQGAIFLHAECQDGHPTSWFSVPADSEVPKEVRTFVLVATGQGYHAHEGKYLKTFTQGPYVWHLHEKIQP